jgi:diacylglycerol O-acyltransferase
MKHLSGIDNLFLAMDHGNQLMQVAALGLYDPSTAPGGTLRFKSVLNFFETRMKQTKVFRRRLVEAPWGLDRPYWIDDSDVDIEYHVRHIALPQPGDWRQLMIQVARLHSRSLDKSKPLWEAYIIEGLDNVPGIAPESFALYIKFHHAAVDGEAGVEIIRAIHSLSPTLDPEDDTLDNGIAVVADRDPTKIELCARAVNHRARQLLDGSRLIIDLGKRAASAGIDAVVSGKALDAGKRAIRQLGPAGVPAGMAGAEDETLHLAPHTRFDGKISAHRVVDAVGFSLEDCASIREHVAGVTINDIFVAATGGALRKYLELKGELPATSLNAMVPLSTRGKEKGHDESNQVSMTIVPLRTDIEDPRERLHAVHRAAATAKQVASALGTDLTARLLEVLPSPVAERFVRSMVPLVNVTVSNVHGPDQSLYLAGAKLQMFTPVSIVINGLGLNITGLSYNGSLWVCFVSCRKMLPDPGVFGKCLTDSFAELVAAATGKAKAAPVAGEGARRPARKARPVAVVGETPVVEPVLKKATAKRVLEKAAAGTGSLENKPAVTGVPAKAPVDRKPRAKKVAVAKPVEAIAAPAPAEDIAAPAIAAAEGSKGSAE